ncbi:sporulation protein YjcZ [Fictibacillus aquaticus]|uniref:sporulation protein YjcZ n=1 Tax=Fictibacillus aquaticus TaxID=2021314 RepID=UPI000D08CB86|nr:sporulation protein YjcZ [Fictibacillus aquaticus]
MAYPYSPYSAYVCYPYGGYGYGGGYGWGWGWAVAIILLILILIFGGFWWYTTR